MTRKFATGISVFVSTLAVFLTGCAPIPLYQPPGEEVERAHIKLEFKDSSLLAGITILRRVQGPMSCDAKRPLENMIILSKGNPLLSDKNPSGVHIAAGQRMSFAAVAMRDGFPACTTPFSFVPESKAQYLLKVSNGSESRSIHICPIQLLAYTGNGIGEEAAGEVSTFQLETCAK